MMKRLAAFCAAMAGFAACAATTYTAYDGAPNANVLPGTHTVTWENPPTGIKQEDCKMTAKFYTIPVPSGNGYMIVDLVFTPYFSDEATQLRVRANDAKGNAAGMNPAYRSGASYGDLNNAPQQYVFRVAYIVPNPGE